MLVEVRVWGNSQSDMLQKFSDPQVRDEGIFDTVFFQQVVATHFLRMLYGHTEGNFSWRVDWPSLVKTVSTNFNRFDAALEPLGPYKLLGIQNRSLYISGTKITHLRFKPK